MCRVRRRHSIRSGKGSVPVVCHHSSDLVDGVTLEKVGWVKGDPQVSTVLTEVRWVGLEQESTQDYDNPSNDTQMQPSRNPDKTLAAV